MKKKYTSSSRRLVTEVIIMPTEEEDLNTRSIEARVYHIIKDPRCKPGVSNSFYLRVHMEENLFPGGPER